MAHFVLTLLSLACLMLAWPGASATSATSPDDAVIGTDEDTAIHGISKKSKKCVPSKKKKCPSKPSKPVKAKKTWQVDEKYSIENGCSRKCWPIQDDNYLQELDLEWESTAGDCTVAGFVAKEGYGKVSYEREDEQGQEVCNAVWENADSEDFKKYGVLEYKDQITVSSSDHGSDMKELELKGEGNKVICVGAVEKCTSGEVQVKFNTSGPATGGLIAGIVIGAVCLLGSIGFAIFAFVTKAFCFAEAITGDKEAPMLINDVEAGSSSSSSSSSSDHGGDDDGGSD